MTSVPEQATSRDDADGKGTVLAALASIEAQLDAITAMDVHALTGIEASDLAARLGRLVAVTGELSGQFLRAGAAAEGSQTRAGVSSAR